MRTVAFIAYPGHTPLDLVGPLQVLTALERMARAGGGDPPLRTVVVGERRDPMGTDLPLALSPTATYAEVPAPDVVVVPGGLAGTVRALGDDRLRRYLQEAAASAQVVASVCTGSLLLAGADLLDGRDATTHWGFHALLERLGARYRPRRWVRDGRFLTAAGVSAGIDMALHLAEEVAGAEAARAVQLMIEYDPQPPQGPLDWAAVDRDAMRPLAASLVAGELADRPELVARLSEP